MGDIFSSKVNAEVIEAVQSNVGSLIIRLNEEEIRIDQYVQQRLLDSLTVYSNLIDKQVKKRYASGGKILNMKGLISQANEKLKGLSTRPRHVVKNIDDIEHKMKNYISETEKLMNDNKIQENEYEHRLTNLAYCAINLEAHNRLSFTQEQNNDFSVLFLTLFLKTSVTSISKILKNSQKTLHGVSQNLKNFDIRNVSGYYVEEVKDRLTKIKDQAEAINQFITKGIQDLEEKTKQTVKEDKTNPKLSTLENNIQFEKKSSKTFLEKQSLVSKSEIVLHQLNKDLQVYENIVEKLYPPVSDGVVNEIKKRISNLLSDHLKNIPDEEDEEVVISRKKSLFDRTMVLLKRLTKIDEENREVTKILQILKTADDNSIKTVESSAGFQEKQEALKTIYKMVNQISTNNTEVTIQKTEIVNRLDGLMVAESMNYLRQLKKRIDYYRMYVQQFVYPKSVPLYQIKLQEISHLKKTISDVSTDKECINKRQQFLLQLVDEVFEIFSKKVNDNEYILSSLEYLNNISKEIAFCFTESSFLDLKIYNLNEFRKRIQTVTGFHQRLVSKKLEIFNQLRGFEENCYSSFYPREIQEIKILLDEHEKVTHQFAFPIDSQQYVQEKNAMEVLWNKIDELTHRYSINVDVWKNNYICITNLLEQTARNAKNNQDHIENLQNIKKNVVDLSTKDLSLTKKLEMLQDDEKYVTLLKCSEKNLDLLTVADNIETIIQIEKSKIEVSKLDVKLQKFKEDVSQLPYPIDKTLFLQHLSEICFLQDYVEDMPEGNSDLNSHKQVFLKEVISHLTMLDEQVAHVMMNRNQSENVLQLENYFNLSNLGDINVDRESVEFVQLIRQRAKYFGNHVQDYLGTSYSVDFYVIHENLMRLLEELDKLSCQDGILLKATVEAISYIKSLMEQLKLNASNQ